MREVSGSEDVCREAVDETRRLEREREILCGFLQVQWGCVMVHLQTCEMLGTTHDSGIVDQVVQAPLSQYRPNRLHHSLDGREGARVELHNVQRPLGAVLQVVQSSRLLWAAARSDDEVVRRGEKLPDNLEADAP